MSKPEHVRTVVVVPRNGLANRLQAWASAAILAAHLDAPLQVLWEPEAPAPAQARDLFGSTLVDRQFIDSRAFEAAVGARHEDVPRYLSTQGDVVVLAGHDRGEQVFMNELLDVIDSHLSPVTLVIIAGGQFHLPDSATFTRQREAFYSGLDWSEAVNTRVGGALGGRGAYAGLHIRQTDRSIEAPPPRAIRDGLRLLLDTVEVRSLFVAADSAAGQERWSAEAEALGFEPWFLPEVDRERSRLSGALDAAADWRLLSMATGVVYPAASTFSTEASVASGHHARNIAVHATAARQRARVWAAHARAAATYPIRHRPLGGQARASASH